MQVYTVSSVTFPYAMLVLCHHRQSRTKSKLITRNPLRPPEGLRAFKDKVQQADGLKHKMFCCTCRMLSERLISPADNVTIAFLPSAVMSMLPNTITQSSQQPPLGGASRLLEESQHENHRRNTKKSG